MTQCAAASKKGEPVAATRRQAMQETATPCRPRERAFGIRRIMIPQPAKAAPHGYIARRRSDNNPDNLFLERLLLVG